MLEQNISDKIATEDNSDLIQQKNNEISKLEKRMGNLITMRADGEISKEIFLSQKADIEIKVSELREQIAELMPYETNEEYETPDYEERITILRYALERYIDFESDKDVPESVIEAFVEKIVVNETSFDWYLRFSGDNQPKKCNIKGRKGSADFEDFTPAIAESGTGCYH